MGATTPFGQTRTLLETRHARRCRVLSAVLLAAFVPSYLFSLSLTGTAIFRVMTSHGSGRLAETAWHVSRAFLAVPVGLLAAAIYFGARGRVGRWHSIWWVHIAVLLLLYVLVTEALLWFRMS